MVKQENLDIEKSIAAFLYPERIIVEIKNKKDEFVWYSTGNFTELPINVTNVQLGNTILNHLEKSKREPISTEQIKQLWDNFKKRAKFKTEKAFMQDAKYVSVFIKNNKIRFEPWKNKISQRTFYRYSDAISEFSPIPEADLIGQEVRNSWEKCIFID